MDGMVRATGLIAAGDLSAADSLLASLEPPGLVRQRLPPLSRVGGASEAPLKRGRPSLSPGRALALYSRDSFTCCYCGKRTVPIPVLRVVSALYPGRVPWHPNWKYQACHPAYWTHTTTWEHVHPWSKGGSDSEENVVTACALCQYTKGDRTLDEMGWVVLARPQTSDWLGLMDVYPALVRRAGLDRAAYHAGWMRAWNILAGAS